MGICHCTDSQNEEAVILEETHKKNEFILTSSESVDLISMKSQAICRGYLVRRELKSNQTLKNSVQSAYLGLLTPESENILKKVLKIQPLTNLPSLKLDDGSIYIGSLGPQNIPSGLGEKYQIDGSYIRSN